MTTQRKKSNLNFAMPKKEMSTAHLFFGRADLWIWLTLILLNGLLFLPFYLFNRPVDFFSINFEATLALALWTIFSARWPRNGLKRFWGTFLAFIYSALIYKSYASVLFGIYQMQPNLYNDYSFISGGLSFLLDALNIPGWYYLTFIAGISMLFVILWMGTHALLVKRATQVGRVTQLLVGSLGLMLITYCGIGYQMRTEMPKGVNSLFVEIGQNVRLSFASQQNLETFIAQNPYNTYDYAQYRLAEKPNVYMIFIESYGSVLYKRPHFEQPYRDMIAAFEERIAVEGWQTTSALSRSPTWGGGSWMAYTSALFGLPVNEQSEYLALRENYQQVPYPNMGRYFHTQGYEYVWVVPINRRLSVESEILDHNFYGADRWITFDTLNYAGPLYGWGPSPPDQYTFGFIQEFMTGQEQPTFLFFLTQNSHYPWIPLPPKADDWHMLSETGEEGGTLTKEEKDQLSYQESRQNYLNALDSTFNTLGDFITMLNDPNAVIVLIGDHQPPTVSNQDDGFSTMVHIISQDDIFLESFADYDFESGLTLNDMQEDLAHAGFYSLFVRNFVSRYGIDPQNLPPYLPNGLSEDEN